MINTYKEDFDYKNDNEWSDSEELPKDALHARFFKFPGSYPNSHQSSFLSIEGKLIRRCDHQFATYQKNPAEYTLEKIKFLIANRYFREAEKRLKVLLEMQPEKHNVDFTSPKFFWSIITSIDKAYQSAHLSQTTRENIPYYQAGLYDWEVKLKALTGVEVPALNRKLQYN
jgi:hypothetical protein